MSNNAEGNRAARANQRLVQSDYQTTNDNRTDPLTRIQNKKNDTVFAYSVVILLLVISGIYLNMLWLPRLRS